MSSTAHRRFTTKFPQEKKRTVVKSRVSRGRHPIELLFYLKEKSRLADENVLAAVRHHATGTLDRPRVQRIYHATVYG